MTRDLSFETNKIYHILNRGVDKRTIFQDNADYGRFLTDWSDEEFDEIKYLILE